MKQVSHVWSGGFTFLEIIIVISIGIILTISSYVIYNSANRQQALQKDAARVASVFEEARSLSVANNNGSSYGVHIDQTKVTRFVGTVYTSGSVSNVEERLSSYVRISTTSPNGLNTGKSDVVFTTLTGTTTVSGTIKLYLISSSTIAKKIRIYGTGLTEITQ